MTNLGNVPLYDINRQSEGIKAMADFLPSADPELAKNHYQIAKKGFQIGKNLYKTHSRVTQYTTYGFRAIAYMGKVIFTLGDVKANVLGLGKRNDIIVVFRVIRKHNDGSVSIVWRMLEEKPSPKLEFDN